MGRYYRTLNVPAIGPLASLPDSLLSFIKKSLNSLQDDKIYDPINVLLTKGNATENQQKIVDLRGKIIIILKENSNTLISQTELQICSLQSIL